MSDGKQWFEYQETDILRKNKIIFIFGEITNELAKEVIAKIKIYNEDKTNSPIWLYINSNGGSAQDTFAIIDFMNISKSPVYTVGMGRVYSAGGVLLIMGKRRFMTPFAEFMAHSIHSTVYEPVPRLVEAAKRKKTLNEKMISLFRKRTKLTEEELNKIRNDELWLDAKQCLKKGIVDEIIKTI